MTGWQQDTEQKIAGAFDAWDSTKYPPHNGPESKHLSPEEQRAYGIADQIHAEAQGDPVWEQAWHQAQNILQNAGYGGDEDEESDEPDAEDEAADFVARELMDWAAGRGLAPADDNDPAYYDIFNALMEYVYEGM